MGVCIGGIYVCVCPMCDSLPISSHPACPTLLLPLFFPPTFPFPLLFLSFPPCPAVYADSNLTGAGLTALKAAG